MFEVGQAVEVSTAYRETGVLRDRSGGWGLKGWAQARVADTWEDGTTFVQFREGGCHWAFRAEEVRAA